MNGRRPLYYRNIHVLIDLYARHFRPSLHSSIIHQPVPNKHHQDHYIHNPPGSSITGTADARSLIPEQIYIFTMSATENLLALATTLSDLSKQLKGFAEQIETVASGIENEAAEIAEQRMKDIAEQMGRGNPYEVEIRVGPSRHNFIAGGSAAPGEIVAAGGEQK
jgi:hypothetical protein